MNNKIIIAEEYTKYPGLRYESLTPGISGERFRDDYLIPALSEHQQIEVILDGNIGQYIPSFLEESFAGLVRKLNLTMEDFTCRIKIISKENPELIEEIYEYIKRELK